MTYQVIKVCFQITSRLLNKKKYTPNKIWTKTAQRGSENERISRRHWLWILQPPLRFAPTFWGPYPHCRSLTLCTNKVTTHSASEKIKKKKRENQKTTKPHFKMRETLWDFAFPPLDSFLDQKEKKERKIKML